MKEAALHIAGLSKSFFRNQVLKKVDIDFYPGEVHVLLGENGAGKSTIFKLIMGQFQPDEGTMTYKGVPITFANPLEAQHNGIAMVYQELSLLPEMTVFDNVFLGREPTVRGLISQKQKRAVYDRVCAKYHIDLDRNEMVRNLPLSRKLMVEVLKVLISDPQVVLFDEATSALDSREVEALFEIIRQLKKENKTIVFISHRMDEIFVIGDTVSVLKDGEMVATKAIKDVTQDQLVEMMVGRSISDVFSPKGKVGQEVLLDVEHLSTSDGILRDICMQVHKGEIVGIAGLKGHGQGELLDCIAGVRKYSSGTVRLNGQLVGQRGVTHAIGKGIILVPEDRKTQALFLNHTIARNLCVSSQTKRQTFGVIHQKKENEFVLGMIDRIAIKCSSPEETVSQLSGGNQQKVIIGRAIGIDPIAILFNEPTRGIDVKTKQDVYRRLRRLADAGVSVLIYSSDLLEVIGISDTVYTIYEGSVTNRLVGDAINEVNIMKGAIGRQVDEA